MLRYLTQKLRAQSLNEVQPYEPKTDLEDSDSSTDSEEENKEVEKLFEDRRAGNGASNTSGPVIMPPHSVRQRPLEDIVNWTEKSLSSDRDRHSSEEELAGLVKQTTPEKRKWSQISKGGNGDVSGSSDEEVKELCVKPMPLKFSASPPKHLEKLSRKHSEGKAAAIFVANVGRVGDFVSARKRCKHAYHLSEHTQMPNGRCVDFEKMQQKQYFRKFPFHGSGPSLSHAHGVRAAKLVRIKGINLHNNRLPPRLLCDPAVFSFRSLSTVNPLTPVEDPSSVATY
ncbi:uncharacterized protein LOC119743155 [Patiria miniata]|uniref:Uncharacterized protein n=1 Tax=Patiria miniata TaxID=46514 RepID=A0A914BHS9_PATMI|nr:uncharacterized protein LOC119743155 [Patiria miniata]